MGGGGGEGGGRGGGGGEGGGEGERKRGRGRVRKGSWAGREWVVEGLLVVRAEVTFLQMEETSGPTSAETSSLARLV